MSSERRGAALGIAAAALFGLSTPLAKLLLPTVPPLLLAGLLYLGGGLVLLLAGLPYVALLLGGTGRESAEAPPSRRDLPLLAAVLVFGGIAGPVLMLRGLQRLSGVTGSLLLTLEGPFTLTLAVWFFREHLSRRALGAALLIFLGAALVGFHPAEMNTTDGRGVLLIACACLAWAIDNNLTQRLSLKDPIKVVRIKALGAGGCMLVIALLSGQPLPAMTTLLSALALGAFSYGISIVLDMYALRLLGAAREAAYFATAPFLGALAAAPILGESPSALDLVAGAAMAAGVTLLVRDRHGHVHTHEPLEHEHLHIHDDHHAHSHEGPFTEPHAHPHRHATLTHDHRHVSDLHHRHSHRRGTS